jgi:lysophospholipase L1-like esterase
MRKRVSIGGAAVVLLASALGVFADPPATSAPATTRPVALPYVPPDQPSVKRARDGQPDKRFLQMHQQFLARGKAGPIGTLFLGDSITEGWMLTGEKKGRAVWDKTYAPMQPPPANFGIGGDRTEHVLWRIDHGELDGIHPKVVVLMIGTNNSGDTAPHITRGVEKVIAEVHGKLPESKLLLLAIFPRGFDPADPKVAALRAKLKAVNVELAKLDDGKQTRYLDIGDKFLADGGVLPKDVMPDSLHPNAKGYQIWADAMQPLLDEMLKG